VRFFRFTCLRLIIIFIAVLLRAILNTIIMFDYNLIGALVVILLNSGIIIAVLSGSLSNHNAVFLAYLTILFARAIFTIIRSVRGFRHMFRNFFTLFVLKFDFINALAVIRIDCVSFSSSRFSPRFSTNRSAPQLFKGFSFNIFTVLNSNICLLTT
jgi:hypothetical protein